MRLCVSKNTHQQIKGKFDAEKLQSPQTVAWFSTRLSLLLFGSTHQQLGKRKLWDGISNFLLPAANEVIRSRNGRKNRWCYDDCRVAMQRKQAVYLTMLRLHVRNEIDTENLRGKQDTSQRVPIGCSVQYGPARSWTLLFQKLIRSNCYVDWMNEFYNRNWMLLIWIKFTFNKTASRAK